jgi:hypothetical protein
MPERTPERRPVGSATSAREFVDTFRLHGILTPEEVARMRELRREGRIGIVLADQGEFFISRNPLDPWGSKKAIGIEELRRVIAETVESLRKAVA